MDATGTSWIRQGGPPPISMGISQASLVGAIRHRTSSSSSVAPTSQFCLADQLRRRRRLPRLQPLRPLPHHRPLLSQQKHRHLPNAALELDLVVKGAFLRALRPGGAAPANPIAGNVVGTGAAALHRRLQHQPPWSTHLLHLQPRPRLQPQLLQLQAQLSAATMGAQATALKVGGAAPPRRIAGNAVVTGAVHRPPRPLPHSLQRPRPLRLLLRLLRLPRLLRRPRLLLPQRLPLRRLLPQRMARCCRQSCRSSGIPTTSSGHS